jgi:hypothetical protein
MIVQTFYAGLNFSSRNLLDSATGGTFMSLTLGTTTKLLDNMMVNYFKWHTERALQGKKVNSVEETSSLSDKIDAIMLMLANDRTHVYPNNVPLASLVAQEEHVDVNFIRNNNFNSYGNSSNNTRGAPSKLEVMLKDFIVKQTAFCRTVEKKLGKIDILASKVFFEPKDYEARAPQQFIERLKVVSTGRDKKVKETIHYTTDHQGPTKTTEEMILPKKETRPPRPHPNH